MLRDLPPYLRDGDDAVFMNGAPGIEHAQEREAETRIDPLDDVFGSAPASPILSGEDTQGRVYHGRPSAADPSDIPRLRSLHITNGYREGIAVSKEKHMQDGFDEGYTLGAELGLKAGWCLGALEGIWHALPAAPQRTLEQAASDAVVTTRESVHVLLQHAETELEVQSLFGSDYFGEDGIWLYAVLGQENEGEEVTFEKVAEAHPCLRKWTEEVLALSGKLGLHLQ
ncbi:hypothetical protein LTR36_005555 [Oleoguttula mirabilis]|uniref:Protein YAE1 n=1 Tax=Oleoguttula mirabilis TaxID=1507867 RepID=A0AAV9JE08_9PEZI|nr:hypothetical protein LTR36_005555 [Oleoguttula mirabilis]